MQHPIWAGVVGTGYVSFHHLRAMRDLPFVQIVGAVDQDPARAKIVSGKLEFRRSGRWRS
jgi:predicted dehydrogenase